MKAKEQIFEFIATELKNSNTIIETTFNGDSVLQSVLQKINESM